MKLGDIVTCTGYIKPSGNHFEVRSCKETESKCPEAWYWERDAKEGIEVEDFLSCERYSRIDEAFTGVFVGTTNLCTKIECEYQEDCYTLPHYRCSLHDPKQFAVVYYANNKKRIVPMDDVKEAERD